MGYLKMKNLSLMLLVFLLHVNLTVLASEVRARISLQELFNPYVDMENGIKGVVSSGGKIEVTILI